MGSVVTSAQSVQSPDDVDQARSKKQVVRAPASVRVFRKKSSVVEAALRVLKKQERVLAKVSSALRTFARGSDDVASSLKRFVSQFGESLVVPTFLADSKSVHIFDALQPKAGIAWSKK